MLAFFQSGLDKVLSGQFDAEGYLTGAVPANGSPDADLFVAIGNMPWFVDFVNVAVPWGEILIGLGLLFGVLTRLAAFWGAFMMLRFYLGNWDSPTGTLTATSRPNSCFSRSPCSAPVGSSVSTRTSSSTK